MYSSRDDEDICPVCGHIIDNDYDICEYCLRNKTEKVINVLDVLCVPKQKHLNFKSGADNNGKN